MTIAACYVSSEGAVLGADSTSSWASANGWRHLNNAQKVFEIGEQGSTLGLVTWGLGGIPGTSYRQLSAELSDSLIGNPPQTTEECAIRWRDIVWARYSTAFQHQLTILAAIQANPAADAAAKAHAAKIIQGLTVGFCIAGHVAADRTPAAFSVLFNPGTALPPVPQPVKLNRPAFWGVPNLMERLLHGIESGVRGDILKSGRWQGSPADLDALIRPYALSFTVELPLREAIDWIFSSIFVTIKAMKFSSMPPMCGGPIEVAVITADRKFRWVCHKGLDQALWDHSTRGKY